MARANIFIRKENEERWSGIKEKSAWINSMVASLDTNRPGAPPVTESITISSSDVPMTADNPHMLKQVLVKKGMMRDAKTCKHGMPPEFCRHAKPRKPCK